MRTDAYMTPEELRGILDEVYAGGRMQRRFAADIGKGEVTISRWLAGVTPIGETEAILIRCVLLLCRSGIRWQKWLDRYKKELNKPKALTLDDIL